MLQAEEEEEERCAWGYLRAIKHSRPAPRGVAGRFGGGCHHRCGHSHHKYRSCDTYTRPLQPNWGVAAVTPSRHRAFRAPSFPSLPFPSCRDFVLHKQFLMQGDSLCDVRYRLYFFFRFIFFFFENSEKKEEELDRWITVDKFTKG